VYKNRFVVGGPELLLELGTLRRHLRVFVDVGVWILFWVCGCTCVRMLARSKTKEAGGQKGKRARGEQQEGINQLGSRLSLLLYTDTDRQRERKENVVFIVSKHV
jgi:hypothetical protein